MGTSRKPKRKVDRGALRVKVYPVLVKAVEAGVAYGWGRAFKHMERSEEPQNAANIRDCIIEAVLSDICERFDFDDQNDS